VRLVEDEQLEWQRSLSQRGVNRLIVEFDT